MRGLRHLLAFIVVLSLSGSATAQRASDRPPAGPALAEHVRARIAEVLRQLQMNGGFGEAREALTQLFDQVIAHAPKGEKELGFWRDAAYALRLVTQLEKAPEESKLELLKYLDANEELGRTLTMLVRRKDQPTDVYSLLNRLRQSRGEQLGKYATLTAAICVVHDRPFERRINENKVTAPDPIGIFDYYSRNESRMAFGIRPVPAELLIYVVDTTSSLEEMAWALGKYAGHRKVGSLFFDIKYDYDHFRRETPKKVTQAGFSLPNILQFGGVCADQAYFATTVGKAIGVPTAYTWGAGADVSHAWVGFLQAQGRSGWWNFDEGRYEAYRGVRGNVLDPQLRERVPDAYVSLLAELIGTKPENRQSATALTDAALRLIEIEAGGQEFAPPAFDAGLVPPSNPRAAAPKARGADVATQLELLELAVKQSPGDRFAWFAVRDLAQAGKLSLAQKRHWGDLLQKICGAKYPDFALALLTPMVETIEDPNEQNKLWNAAFTAFQARPDLAAAIRMAQASMWEKNAQPETALKCYLDVVERYANSGPFVVDALEKAEEILRRSNRADAVLVLYQQAWSRIAKPRDMAGPFMAQSNWVQVGMLLAQSLHNAGRMQEAQKVRSQFQAVYVSP